MTTTKSTTQKYLFTVSITPITRDAVEGEQSDYNVVAETALNATAWALEDYLDDSKNLQPGETLSLTVGMDIVKVL